MNKILKILDNNFTLDKKTMNINKKIAIIIGTFELSLLLLFLFNNFIKITHLQYICFFIFIPNLINGICLFFGTFLINKKTSYIIHKIYIPLIVSIIMLFTIVLLHYNLSLHIIFIFPIYQTLIFGDKNISKNITIVSIILINISFLLHFYTGLKDINTSNILNIIVTNIIFVLAYSSVNFLINHEAYKEYTLYNSLNKQIFLKKQLEKDQLSGLYNHSYLFDKLNLNIKNQEKMCLAVIDIDFFKKVNDTYGHENGNIVIRKLGEIMLKYKNEDIIPARYGGEEFAIVFVNKNEKEALYIMEKIKKEFSSYSFKELEDKNVTFSCGISVYKNNLSSESFFTQADEAMYFAKNNGRDSIILRNDIE